MYAGSEEEYQAMIQAKASAEYEQAMAEWMVDDNIQAMCAAKEEAKARISLEEKWNDIGDSL